MGMNRVTISILIRRYDRLECEADKLQIYLKQVSFEPESTFDDVKIALFGILDLEDDGSRVLKIRRHDNKLIPIMSLFDDPQNDKPFILDVVRVHQYCPAMERTIPSSYVDAFKLKLKHLENRVLLAENTIPELEKQRIAAIEETATQLANCVNFLDRRLDELAPPHWKAQIGSDTEETRDEKTKK